MPCLEDLRRSRNLHSALWYRISSITRPPTFTKPMLCYVVHLRFPEDDHSPLTLIKPMAPVEVQVLHQGQWPWDCMEQGPFQAVCVVYIGYTGICTSLRKMMYSLAFTWMCAHKHIQDYTADILYTKRLVYVFKAYEGRCIDTKWMTTDDPTLPWKKPKQVSKLLPSQTAQVDCGFPCSLEQMAQQSSGVAKVASDLYCVVGLWVGALPNQVVGGRSSWGVFTFKNSLHRLNQSQWSPLGTHSSIAFPLHFCQGS